MKVFKSDDALEQADDQYETATRECNDFGYGAGTYYMLRAIYWVLLAIARRKD